MGTLNLYFGGSGKFVAEVLKGTAAYYGLEVPKFVAFDIETAPMHSGTFTLGNDLMTVDPSFPDFAQTVVAVDWANRDAGRAIEPRPFVGGPQQRLEVSAMRRIGMNLLELPVLFYVVCAALYVTGQVDGLAVNLAWAYVALRVVHSVVHISYNNVIHRLSLFAISNFVLMALWIVFGLRICEAAA